jgi:hypothetical protein
VIRRVRTFCTGAIDCRGKRTAARGSALSRELAAVDAFNKSHMRRKYPTDAVRATQIRTDFTRRFGASALLAALLASAVTLAAAPAGNATGDGKPAATAAPKPSNNSQSAGNTPRLSPYLTYRKQHAAAETAARPAADGVAVKPAAATPIARPRKPAGQSQRSQ